MYVFLLKLCPSPLPLGSVTLDCSGPDTPSTDMALLLVVEDPELAAAVVGGGGAAVANDGMGLLAD